LLLNTSQVLLPVVLYLLLWVVLLVHPHLVLTVQQLVGLLLQLLRVTDNLVLVALAALVRVVI
jgi:hypothetical protein